MTFQDEPGTIRWRLHLKSPPEQVYRLLSTDQGRARFWAESAVETAGRIHFRFPNGLEHDAEILDRRHDSLFRLEYIGGTTTSFELSACDSGGTELVLTDRGVAADDHTEVTAGWVSVLLALKAAADFSVDLRNHDPARTWEHGYAEN